MTFPLPTIALDDRLAFVGTSGSGKTYAASASVEHLLAQRARCVIVDPLGVWYGLRLVSDGKTASPFDVVIFGGNHGDLPLNEHVGSLIGETVAGMKESCIIDLSGLAKKSDERRFMLAFLDSIYRKTDPRKSDPYHIIFDEADLWAPQKSSEPMLQSRMEEIVRRGRIRGFIPWLITQRPAVLSKDVLSQADGLIALKLTSSQDRDAIGAWIEGQADRQHGKAILAALPTMQTGQGVVWLPGRGILETVQFPPKATFDSSRTPKRGEKKHPADLKPLNIEALKERLAAVEQETKENDPKALKGEIARLTRQLAGAKSEIRQAEPDLSAIRKVAFEEGRKAGASEAMHLLNDLTQARLSKICQSLRESRDDLQEVGDTVAALGSELDDTFTPPKASVLREPPSQSKRIPQSVKSSVKQGDDLPGPQQRILNSLATWAKMGHPQPTNAQVAWLARYSPASSSYKNARGELKAASLVDYPAADVVALADGGKRRAVAIEIRGTLLDYVISQLPGPEQRILAAVSRAYPKTVSNERAAHDADYSPASSSYKNSRGSLKARDLITYPNSGMVRAADWLFA